MRKLLLASVAALGALGGLAGYAQAQTAIYSENPNAPQPAPQLFERKAGGSGGLTYAPPTIKPATPEPAPGQMIIRLSGFLATYQQYTSQGDAKAPPAAGSPPGTGGAKLANYQFYSYARLYPSLEGKATNGLKYGAFFEIRSDAGRSVGAGGGVANSISGSVQGRGVLYFRRTYGYFGTDQLGVIRVGAGDQPTSLFLTGNMENFDDGGWNGDLPDTMTSAIAVAWPFEDTGNLYTTQKVVYLSPQFAGFDFGVSYEPDTSSIGGQTGCNSPGYGATSLPGGGGSGATAGCDALSSTGVVGELSRRRNTFDGVLRYRGVFGPVGVAATGGFIFSSKINSGDTPAAFAAAKGINYDGLSVGDFGATATFAGFILGGHVTFGDFNPVKQFNSLNPSGEAQGLAYVVGASYQPVPSFIVGTHYFKDWGSGNKNPLNAASGVGELTEQGVAVGATYSVTPGFNFFLSSIWGSHKESGYNFVTGSTASTGALGTGLNQFDHNKTTTWAVGLGEAFHW